MDIKTLFLLTFLFIGCNGGSDNGGVEKNDKSQVSISGAAQGSKTISVIMVSGRCETGHDVNLKGDINPYVIADCLQGTFEKNVVLDGVDGSKIVTAFQLISGKTYSSSRSYVKDTTPPSSLSFSIDNEAIKSRTANVDLKISAVDAVEMYVTNNSNCSTGGEYIPYSTQYNNWTMGAPDGDQSVYIKFKDELGNESSCISDSITVMPSVVDIATTQYGTHVCVVMTNGKVFCWGRGDFSTLGDGNANHSSAPVEVLGITTAKKVDVGLIHSCAMLEDGTAKCWGHNGDGQLGINSNAASSTPTQVFFSGDYSDISLGESVSCALTSSGLVECWGSTYHTAIGRTYRESTGNPADRSYKVPGQLYNSPGAFSSFNTGSYTSCGITSDGSVYCFGDNEWGVLGSSCFVSTGRYVFDSVDGIADNTKVNVGWNHACAINNEREVTCWGGNENGQLGNVSSTACQKGSLPVLVNGITDAIDISLGYKHSCALLSDKSVVCWGLNDRGQLGDNSTVSTDEPTTVSTVSNIVKIAAGRGLTCAVDEESYVWCWGRNDYGQVGDGTTVDKLVPVKVELPN